jgi:hypothetical protein
LFNLFQKRVVRTIFDICVFITITASISSPRGYHSPNSHCFGIDTDMLYYRNVHFLNNVSITNVLLSLRHWRPLSSLSILFRRFGWLSCLGALVYLLPIRVLIIVLSILLTLNVSDEGYSRNVSCALNMISTFFSCTYWNIMFVFLKIVKKSDLQSVEFLNDLTKIMVKKVEKKQKCIQTVYALLRLITKGITHRLCKGKHYCSLFLCK